MSGFIFFIAGERKNIKTLLMAAKAGKKRAQGRLLKELNLKIADKRTLARLNHELVRGKLNRNHPWL